VTVPVSWDVDGDEDTSRNSKPKSLISERSIILRDGIGILAVMQLFVSIKTGSCFTVNPGSRKKSPEYTGSAMTVYFGDVSP
jgi:hypothetical protein